MRLGSVRVTGLSALHFRIALALGLLMSGLFEAAPAPASHGWLDLASVGRWRSFRDPAAPSNGLDRRFELADLNGDGKLDYAGNVEGGVMSALGNGDGTFQDLQFFGDGATAKGSFALGDLNGDGDLDAVTADVNTGQTTVSVFLGDGTGGFGPRTGWTAGSGRRWLALGDVNRDGKLDLAYAGGPTGGPYTVGVVLGNGTGGFGGGSAFAEASQPSELTLSDLNGDGRLDMLWIQSSPNQVCFRLGNGAGSFGAATRLVSGTPITDVQAADVNSDSRLDLAWTRDGGALDTTWIALALPAGGFGAPSPFSLLGDSETIGIGDFNEDGKVDFVSLLKDGRVVFTGDGNGMFTPIDFIVFPPVDPGAGVPINFALTNVVVADVNRDGHDDIVYGLPAVDLGNGNGSFGDACALKTAAGPSAAIFARVDADALPDLVVACRGAGVASVLFNSGAGGFLPKQDFPIGSGAVAIASADFDASGRADIVTANQNANTVSLLRNNGLNAFHPKVDFAVGSRPVALRAPDLNADGKPDLVVVNNLGGSVSVMLGNGAGSFGPRTDYPVSNPGPTDVAVADFNGDSKLDLAIAGSFAGFGGILLRMGNGDGTFGSETVLELNQPKRSLVAADFDKDGIQDLAATDVQFHISVLRGTGGGAFAAPVVYHTSSNAFAVEVADLDNDGRLDLLLGHSFGFFWTMRGLPGGAFEETGYGHAGRGVAGPLFTGRQLMAASNYMLNGRVSVAIVGETTNSITLIVNRGPQVDIAPQAGWLPPQHYATQADPRGLAVADFNRDGRRDAAAAAAGTNTVSLHLGDGRGNFAPATGYDASSFLRNLAVSDVSRDGKADALSVGQNGMLSILLGDGAGALGPKIDVDSGGTSHDVAIGDIDRNGTQDAIVDDTSTGSLRAYPGAGDGSFGAAVLSALPAGPSCAAMDVDLADLNGDGKLDAVAAIGDCGQVNVMFGNGALGFSGTSLTMGSQPGRVVTADLNRDGRLDLAAADLVTGSAVVRLQDPSTPGAFLSASSYVGIAAPGDIAAADVDQDGDLDLLIGSTVLSAYAVLKNNGSGAFGGRVEFPMSDPVVSMAVEDLNRDGLIDVLTTGSNGSANSISVRLGTRTIITSVETPPVNAAWNLEQNRPNPFNPVTRIRFALGRTGPVRLAVFDARGRLVKTLLDETMTAGTHEVSWTGRNQAGMPAASGVYFYKLEAGEHSMSRRMVLLK